MKQKNYYEILGINRRNSKDEIKLAYRKLAKKYHPDTNADNNEAEEKFKDVNEAYDILTDDEKRKRYDRQVSKYRYGFEDIDGSLPNVKYEFKSGINVINELLSTILGLKKDDKDDILNQFEDEIEGQSTKMKQKPEHGTDIETNLEITIEEAFFGTEKKIAIKGYKGGLKTFSVNVPVGIKDGEKIRLSSLGLPGKNGGKNGDLIITAKIKDHAELKLKGCVLSKEITISPAFAAVGGKYKLNFFNEDIFINLPKHLKNGQKITIEEKGYIVENNKRGDLIIVINIDMPEDISDREEKLYEQILKLENKKKK
ncbi:MAG: J domain-containing protein [Clostridia bacterium]|nr:J domain-containing protein [Clostridia bacterium]